MIHDNPHHFLERHADDVGSFLERQLAIHRAAVRRKLAVASGVVGLVAVAGLTVLYLFGALDGDSLPDGVKKANVVESQPKGKVLTADELNERWQPGSANEALVDELAAMEDPADIRRALAGFPFADLRPDILEETNLEIRDVIRAIKRSGATEHRSRVEEWLESPYTDSKVKRLAKKCLIVLESVGESDSGGAGAAGTRAAEH